MKEVIKLLRLKTTTKLGKVFLGPFIYDLDARGAKQKLKQLNWLIPKYKSGEKEGEPIGLAAMELIEVAEAPRRAMFNPNSIIWDFEDLTISFIKTLEERWEEMEDDIDKENFD